MSVEHRLAYPSPNHTPQRARPECLGIPNELIQLHQWLAFRAIPKPNGKINKPPIDANTGGPGSSTNAATWGSFLAASRRSPSGAAFVLTPDDPYFALDLDECVNAETGEISPEAKTIVDRFPIYWEISYSGTGLRGIGRGILPKSGCKKGNIEVYDQGRYVVMTGRTLPGHETIRNCQRELVAWHAEVWPIETEQPPRPQPVWSGIGMTNDEILAKAFNAKNGEKIRRLYHGDTSGYTPSQSDPGFSSEADQALVNYLCGYTPDDDQLADLWRTSGLYRKKLDRTYYVERTIQQARKGQSWAYDPNHGTTPRLTLVPKTPPSDAPPETRSNAELLAQLDAAYAVIAERDKLIAEKDAHIIRLQDRVQIAEEKAQRLSFERSQVMQVLRAPDLNAGEKLTHFAQVIDIGARIANGEEPTPAGFRSPSGRIAEMTGQPVSTVQRHRRSMHARGIFQKQNVREETDKDHIDPETGEILTETGKRDVTYLRVPDNNIINLITPAVAYERPDDAPQRGGKREPRCTKHPNASTTTTHNTTCDECGAVIDQYKTHHHPTPTEESSHIKLEPETNVVNTVLRGSSFAPETVTTSTDFPNDSSGSSLLPEPAEPSWLWESRPDDPGPPPDWQNEHRRTYGRLYRGEAVS